MTSNGKKVGAEYFESHSIDEWPAKLRCETGYLQLQIGKPPMRDFQQDVAVYLSSKQYDEFIKNNIESICVLYNSKSHKNFLQGRSKSLVFAQGTFMGMDEKDLSWLEEGFSFESSPFENDQLVWPEEGGVVALHRIDSFVHALIEILADPESCFKAFCVNGFVHKNMGIFMHQLVLAFSGLAASRDKDEISNEMSKVKPTVDINKIGKFLDQVVYD